MRSAMIGGALAGVMALAIPAVADEVRDSIQEALAAYEKNDLAAAKQALDYASELINQKNAEDLGAVLPKPMAGWTADDLETSNAAAGLFGGTRVARSYNKSGARVAVQVLTDSPMLASWMPMLANPKIAAAVGKLTKVSKYRAMQTKKGQLILVVANRYLIIVDGSGSFEDKTAYAEAIDFNKLEAF